MNAETLALAALGWILGEESRALRFLELTGLDPDGLRTSLSEPTTLCAVMEFLSNHEPDMVKAAEALAVTPEELAAAAQELTR